MSFMEEQSSKGAVDEQFQAFIETESKKQQFQGLAYSLTDICWEVCVDAPSSRLGTKVEKCLMNCVERFIDTTNFITNRLDRVALLDNRTTELNVQ